MPLNELENSSALAVSIELKASFWQLPNLKESNQNCSQKSPLVSAAVSPGQPVNVGR
jgi:hypothetical protein